MNRQLRPAWALGVGALLAGLLAAPARGADSPADLARRARQVFEAHCYLCHGKGGKNEGGFNVVLDLKKLVATRRVVPNDPRKSKVYQRMTSASNAMPPEFDESDQSDNPKPLPRPSKDDIAAVEAWIKAGAPDVPAAGPARPFLSEPAVLALILADLESIGDRDRPYARYFTITHLYNAGFTDDQLLTYRNALSKLVNSLSWGRKVKAPRAIDPAGTVFRIDLRDFKWDEAIWTAILAHDPYGVTYPGKTAESVYRLTHCALPYVRADWFVLAASQPPLYHEVLQLPKTDRELEARLDVDVAANVRHERVDRAAFNSSGVSRNNRMIERHESSFGAYWKSYDFAGNVGRQKLLTNPLGPGDGPRAFKHDGGEIIFNLPNGFQAYMLTKADGTRLDKGPTNIVLDKEQPDSAVVNGISCMRCHKYGTIAKTDQVRELAELAGVFPEDVAATIKALYPTRGAFEALLKEDADRFARAVRESGAPLSETEPIFELARQFENELDLVLAAAESGQQPGPFKALVARSPRLVESLVSLLVSGGTVKRDTFVAAFPDIVAALRLGTYIAASNAPARIPVNVPARVPAPPAKITNSVGMTLVPVPAGSFSMGSDDGEDDEKPKHTVRITKPFYLAATEVTQAQYQQVTGATPSFFKGPGSLPVEQVSWFDAVAFCNKLSLKENLRPYYAIDGTNVSIQGGSGYRLPTEAEWEHACRAGSTTKYSFGDDPSLLGRFAWFDGNSKVNDSYTTHPAGEKEPNKLGLFDMHGNLFEWCWDVYDKDFYKTQSHVDPTGPITGTGRVLRGGCYFYDPVSLRSAFRLGFDPANRLRNDGFRPARTYP